MKKWQHLTFLILNLILLPCSALANTNLIDVYQDALMHDPTFQAAQAQNLGDQENLAIARSYLLPNLAISGATLREYEKQLPVLQSNVGAIPLGADIFWDTSNIYQLNVSQPIFNYSAWYTLRNASYTVKQAEATFAAAAQDLMIRVAKAYFAVLQASDTLNYTITQKDAVLQQLQQTQKQFKAGLIAIAGVSEAQANYDTITANEIAAKNNLADAVEQLRAISGKTYPELMAAGAHLPLVVPKPADMERWVTIAQNQNYTLKAAIENVNAAQEEIKVRIGGHLPVLNATGNYYYNRQSNPGQFGFREVKTASGGVSLNFPIYQGGLVSAQTEQASYQYQQAISQMEYTHEGVVAQTRQAYYGIVTGIDKIQADLEAIVSSELSLKATREGYIIGSRNILDVLNTQTTLFQAQINYSTDQYSYLTNILTLKQAAGTLSPSDLLEVNAWLTRKVNIAASIAHLDIPSNLPSSQPHPLNKHRHPQHHLRHKRHKVDN